MKIKTTMEITTGTMARFLLLLLSLVFLYVIRDIVMIILVSIIVASSVEPLVKWFVRYRFPRVFAVLLIYVTGFFSFFTIFYLLIPPLANDFRDFLLNLPMLVGRAFAEVQERMPFLPSDIIVGTLQNVAENADAVVRSSLSGTLRISVSVVERIISVILIFVISFYLAVQEDGIANFLRIVTPREHEPYILSLWSRSQRKIGRWLQGQILLGLIIGVVVFIALTILQVEYAFILAVLSALFEIIPYFGPIMAAIPAIAVAAIQSPFLGLLVGIIFFFVQQIENHLIYPQVVRKTVGVPPLLAIIALLVGGKIAGPLGIIIAIPVAVVLVEYMNDLAEHKKNLL